MVLRKLADFAVARRAAGLDAEVEHASARAVVDWFAATVVGSTMPPAQILAGTFVAGEGSGSCRLVPDGRRADVRTAALINATASHTAELDDIYREGIYHPGSPTVGAALAVAENTGASGKQLLRAIAVGYEVGDRIAAAVQPAHYTYWHTTGTIGTIGAAAAVAELLELDAERMTHALATATTMAAGLQQAFRVDTMSKPLHAGHAADAGVLAAMAAANGFTGAPDVLDGPVGFGMAMAGGPDWSQALAGLGGSWGITRPTVKNHSCCGHTFAAIDAVQELRATGLRPDDVEKMRISTYRAATEVAGKVHPTTGFEAKFSISYCAAAALELGTVRLRAFEDEQLANPGIRALLDRTTVDVEPDYDASFPGQRAARVVIVDRSGNEHVRVRKTRKGDPDDPLTDAELNEKFTELAVPVIGRDQSEALARSLWSLAELPDMRELPVAAGQAAR